MDADSWFNHPSSNSMRFYSQSEEEEEEEVDSEDELNPEFLCPFCGEDFDFVSLCCHSYVDHAVEVKRGVCPICSKKVGIDLLCHVTEQHSSLLKYYVHQKRRYGSILALSLMKKQIQDESSHAASPSDQLLSSFLRNVVIKDEHVTSGSNPPLASVDEKTENAPVLELSSNRSVGQSSVLADDKDEKERVRKCEFVRGLLLSTFMEDG